MKKLLEKLAEKALTLGSIESMTGGLFAAEFTSIPGSSKVFKGSVVTYATEIKEKVVGVNAKTIEQNGVVSEEVAKEMADCGRKLLGVDICIAVTGNAGPTCEPGGKPAGYFCIAVSTKNETVSEHYQISKKRNCVRNRAVLAMRDLIDLKII